jgi:O-6-methylguanine DNA methyltransferase
MIQVYTQNIKGSWFGVTCNEQRVFGTSFGKSQQKVLENLLGNLPFNMPFQVFSEPLVFAKKIIALLADIYDGKDVNLDFPIAIEHLPAYTRKVLKATAEIPPGYVTSYGSVAKAVGGGPRAVGNIMAANPFAPIIPCHRVVKSDFTLGGYGGGLKVKLELLGREKRGFPMSKSIEVNGSNLQVFPVEYVLRNFK